MLVLLKNFRFTHGLARWKKRQDSAQLQLARQWVNLHYLSENANFYSNQSLPSHHGLRSYNSLNFLCTALCSKNTRASKGLAGYTQSFNYAFGMFPRYFGFCGLRRKEVTALQSYLVKGQGWNIKNAINQSFFDRFWWKFVCSFLSDLHLRMQIFS